MYFSLSPKDTSLVRTAFFGSRGVLIRGGRDYSNQKEVTNLTYAKTSQKKNKIIWDTGHFIAYYHCRWRVCSWPGWITLFHFGDHHRHLVPHPPERHKVARCHAGRPRRCHSLAIMENMFHGQTCLNMVETCLTMKTEPENRKICTAMFHG